MRRLSDSSLWFFCSTFLLLGYYWVGSAATHPFTIRYAGGYEHSVFTKDHQLWYGDVNLFSTGFSGIAAVPSLISPQLNHARWFPRDYFGPENCCMIDEILDTGVYFVRIYPGMMKKQNYQEPCFDISINGTSIGSLKHGWSTKDKTSFIEAYFRFVIGTSMTICFHNTGHGDPAISGMLIQQVHDNAYHMGEQWQPTIMKTVIRLNFGTDDTVFDSAEWGGQRYWSPYNAIGKSLSTSSTISNTSVLPNVYPESIYQTAVVSSDHDSSQLVYEVVVDPNHSYGISLHFAEIDPNITLRGKRVFDVMINGETKFENVDIIGFTGRPNRALVLETTVFVDMKMLIISIHPKVHQTAIWNALEVFELVSVEYRTISEQVSALKDLEEQWRLPQSLGWNGDPCVPPQHVWTGIKCEFNTTKRTWTIVELSLSGKGIKGTLVVGPIVVLVDLQVLDLSNNSISGAIPKSLANLKSLKTLNLDNNLLSGKVPQEIVNRVHISLLGNEGVCGSLDGLHSCAAHLVMAAKYGIGFGIAFLIITVSVGGSILWWKRRQRKLIAHPPQGLIPAISEENSKRVLLHEGSNSSTSTSQTPTPVGGMRLSSLVRSFSPVREIPETSGAQASGTATREIEWAPLKKREHKDDDYNVPSMLAIPEISVAESSGTGKSEMEWPGTPKDKGT